MMKKITYLLAGLLAVSSLTACGGDEPAKPKNYPVKLAVTGGSEAEQTAIKEVVNFKPLCSVGETTITVVSKPNLKQDASSGNTLMLTTKQTQTVSGKNYTVTIEWAVDETSEFFGHVYDYDANHKQVELNYPGYKEGDYTAAGTFSWDIKKLTCGEATCDKQEDGKAIRYTANVFGQEYYHEDIKIADVLKVNAAEKRVEGKDGAVYVFPGTYDLVDYEYDPTEKTYSPYFEGNNPGKEKDYRYVNVTGKVIYLAPDGNWGLIADGNNILEIYAGAGTKLTEQNFPHFKDKYVTVVGNISQYCGNVQLGFITEVKGASADDVTEPTCAFTDTVKADLQYLKASYLGESAGQKIAVPGLSNALRKVTGTIVSGSLKDRDGKATTVGALVNNRFTFEIKVDGEKIVVAYDYHTDGNGSVGLFNALKAKLQAGGSITVNGTARYSGMDTNPFLDACYSKTSVKAEKFSQGTYYTRNEGTMEFTKATEFDAEAQYYKFSSANKDGVWTIVPYLAEHVA